MPGVLSIMKLRIALCLALVLSIAVSVVAQTGTGSGTSSTQTQSPNSPRQAQTEEEANPGDPLLDVPKLPEGNVTLVGGTVLKIDQIRNRFVVEPFGGGDKLKMSFDERTRIFRDGTETTQIAIHKGDRVYVDTMLDGGGIFARNIRIQSQVGPADAGGQVETFDPTSGVLRLRDQLSSEAVSFRLDSGTAVKRGEKNATLADVKSGSLVTLRFAPGGRARGVVKEISILAVPGTSFTFVGKVTHLDLRSRSFAVENQSDGKNYDLMFDPAKTSEPNRLMVGSEVTVVTTFTGTGYRAESITIHEDVATE
jgi:hypothetical protein